MNIGLIGTILKGRYCILEKISKGGEGNLYLARDLELGTLWAIKQIPSVRKKEAKLLRFLEHPAIPVMVDYVEKDQNCYLVMEYIKGQSLADALKNGKKLTVKEIVKIGITLTEVLEYLHTRKPSIYYGDLKPSNIMMTENGKLYLVDFGSSVVGYEERIGICYGTRGYAAPEQYEGKVGIESDVYALGKTLEVLCGKRRMWYILEYPGFGFFLWKCTRKNKKKRYVSMKKARKKLQKVEENKKTGIFVIIFFSLCIAGGGFFYLLQPEKNIEFEKVFTKVTNMYYETGFIQGKEREKICREVERKLQNLLDLYQEEENQRRILLLLALNAQLQKEEERAVFYFEQLRIYHPNFEETYGEYGNYLIQIGDKEKNRKLWIEYFNKEKKGIFDRDKSKNTKVWADYMEKEMKQENEEK